MRPLLATVGLLLLFGWHSPAAAGLFNLGWTWQAWSDTITDKPHWMAQVVGIPDVHDTAALVTLHCPAGAPAIVFKWDTGVTKKTNWLLEYRFAGQPGHRLNAKYVNRSAQIVTDLGDIKRFLSEARLSSSFLVRVSSNAYGVNDATFGTARGPETVVRLVAACPRATLQ